MKTQSWGNTLPLTPHATLASISQGKSTEISSPPPPNLKDMAPGDTVQFDTRPPVEKVTWNTDDLLVFKNGAKVEDLENEGGLKITHPDGEVTLAKGWVDRDDDGPCVYTRTYVPDQEEWMCWKQSFPSEGGLVMERLPDNERADRSVTISPNGELSAAGYHYEERADFQASLDGKALVLRMGDQVEAFRPALPIEWFITK
jgi:hypothetical protein